MAKRLFDIFFSIILIVILCPLWVGVLLWMSASRDLPVLYVSERMKTTEKPFRLYKFRTMRAPKAEEENTGVSGGDKAARITPLGHFLRSKRLDEIPQLINILKGDMSFVGPRPPLRQYTQSHHSLYAEVLKSKPGVTGLASMVFHKHEEYLLSRAKTLGETDAIYRRACIPKKARIDLIYQEHSSICFDVFILLQTVRRVFGK